MRLQIKGEITLERLEKALAAAREQFRQCGVPDARFFNANLYLVAYDANGLPVNATNHAGEEIMLSFPPEPGSAAKPPVTPQGRAQKDAALAEEAQRDERIRLLDEALWDLRSATHAHRMAQADEVQRGIGVIESITTAFLEWEPSEFVADLNACLAQAWMAHPPPIKSGESVPPATPTFGLEGGQLYLYCAGWKKPRRTRSPLALSCNSGRYRSRVWLHAAWRLACRLMAASMVVRLHRASTEGLMVVDDASSEDAGRLLGTLARGGVDEANAPYRRAEFEPERDIAWLEAQIRVEYEAREAATTYRPSRQTVNDRRKRHWRA